MFKILSVFLGLTSFGSVIFAGPNNPLIGIKVYPKYNAIEINRSDIRNFTEPPILESKSKNYNSIKSHTFGMAPDSWNLTVDTTKGISGFYAHPRIKVQLNERAREMNRPNPRQILNINQPDFQISLDRGEQAQFRYAIKEQGIKRFLAQGGSLTIAVSNFDLVVDPLVARVLTIREPDSKVLIPNEDR